MSAETIGSRLRLLRNRKGVSLQKVANDLNSSRANISRYELDQVNLTIKTVIDLSKYYKVTTDYILKGETHGNRFIEHL